VKKSEEAVRDVCSMSTAETLMEEELQNLVELNHISWLSGCGEKGGSASKGSSSNKIQRVVRLW